MIPDAEKIVSDHLRADPAVAGIVARRVVGKTPASTTDPWVRVTQLDDKAVGGHRSDHLIAFLMQFDCYAGANGGQPQASLLNRTVREALRSMPGAHDSAVVTAVEFAGGSRIPDQAFEPARERFVRTATIYIHST